MPKEAALFDAVNGNVLDAYLVLEAGKTVGPMWIDNAQKGRKKLEKELGKLMKAKKLDAIKLLKEWETRYRKECFYRGLRALLELQWYGKTKY
jgi:hypothetical protein